VRGIAEFVTRGFVRARGGAEFATSSLVFAVALASRLWGIESRSIWMDEDSQARRVLEGDFSLDLVKRAATQQQPPIDYFVQHFGFEYFGVTPLGARVHAAVFGALAVLWFYRLSKRVFGGGAPVVFGTVLMLLHPLMIYYSQEGRPISCGVFFATLFLANLHGFVLLPATRWRRALRGLGLLVSTWCFQLSLGMQPVILIAVLAGALFPGLFVKSLRPWVLSSWAIFVAAFGLAWPVLASVIGQSDRYVDRAPLSDRLLNVLAKLLEPPFQAWQFQLGELLEPLWPPVLLLLSLGLWGLVNDFRQRRQPATLALTVFCLLSALLFPWVLGAIFAAVVNWPLKPRYFATLTPVVLLLLALLLHHATPIALRLAARSRRVKLAVITTLVAWLGWTGVVQARASATGYTKPKQDWAGLYALFKQNQRRGTSYMVSLRPPGEPERGYYALRFYYPSSDAQPIKLKSTRHLRPDYKHSKKFLREGNVYVTIVDGWKEVRPLGRAIEERVPGARFHALAGASVIELRPTKQGRAALLQLFEVLAERLKPTRDTWRALHMLAWLRIEDGDLEGARKLVLQLKKLDSKQLNREAADIRRAIKKLEARSKNKSDSKSKPQPAKASKESKRQSAKASEE